MKRILFFLLLLLNLQLTTDNDSLSIYVGNISAQRLMDMQLPNITRGYNWVFCYCCSLPLEVEHYEYHLYRECWAHNVPCEECGSYVTAALYYSHLADECPRRKVQCYICEEYYTYCEGHLCKRCVYCGRPITYGEFCDCPGCEIYGQLPWWMYEGGWLCDWYDDYYDDDVEYSDVLWIPNTEENKEDKKHPHQSFQELRKSSNIKWLGNKRSTIASENLNKMTNMHPQEKGMHDCVPRAFAFLEELWYGLDYETALEKNIKKCKAMDIDVFDDGFSDANMDSLEQQKIFFYDPKVICYENDIETIKTQIDNGNPIAAAIVDVPLHMVVIIGYEDNTETGPKFYVAGGNGECHVSIIGTSFIRGKYVYGIK